ncbi:hypothetical protein ND16A_3241 [Thalassotalea sp. ND16A]|nr:hypothetical protein ND16A_3241 [Thalassotalea sp. ND16A]
MAGTSLFALIDKIAVALDDLLMKAAAHTLLTIGADEKHLGARLGVTFVLHTWGSAMTHHPHVHGIVPGGGLSIDGEQWVPCKSGFFLPVRVLSRLFRRLYLEKLDEIYQQGRLMFLVLTESLKMRWCLNSGWHRFGKPNGWCMLNGHLLVLKLCWLTCHVIRTALPCRTVG